MKKKRFIYGGRGAKGIAALCTVGFMTMSVASGLEPRYANEWNFETDAQGLALPETANLGVDSPLKAVFGGVGSGQVLTAVQPEAGHVLLCTGSDPSPDFSGNWTAGEVLDAPLASIANSGVHYLRYDVTYDLESDANKSGTVLGVYFADESQDRLSGFLLNYEQDRPQGGIPAGVEHHVVERDLALSGTLTAIAEVNLDVSPARMKVWFSLDGSIPSEYGHPADDREIRLNSIDRLRFHATGDFRPAGTDDFAAVENIRHTVGTVPGGAAWMEIIEPRVDLTRAPVLDLFMEDDLGFAMDVGQTNEVRVIVHNQPVGNRAAPAEAVFAELTHDAPPSVFTVESDGMVAPLLRGAEAVTNRFRVVAHEPGRFIFTAIGRSVQADSAPLSVEMRVGRNLDIFPVTSADIEEVPGTGSYPGFYEPGETLRISVTTTNNGALTVSGVINSLSAPADFAIHPLTPVEYGDLAPGESASTVYEVVIGGQTPLGIYPFVITSTDGDLIWSRTFDLEVSTRLPSTDWVKADNEADLDQPSSWTRGQVPDRTDRAVLDDTVSLPITTAPGSDLAWRGIVLDGNTVDWTIRGPGTLSIGSAGIDMREAEAGLTIESGLHLDATQTWDVGEFRTLRVAGSLAGGPESRLIKTGKGVLEMVRPGNPFAGGMIVSNGTVRVAGMDPLGTGTLQWMDGVLETTAAASLGNSVDLQGTGQFLNTHSLTLSGQIKGERGIEKTGSGALILRGANVFSGGIVNSGTIEVGNAAALGSGSVVMNERSSLDVSPQIFSVSGPGISNAIWLNGSAVLRAASAAYGSDPRHILKATGPISGPGGLRLEGNQVLLHGNNTFEGGLELAHSSWLRINGPAALGSGEIVTAGGGLLVPQNGGRIDNAFHLRDTPLRLNLNNLIVELAGHLRGVRPIDLRDSNGELILSGNNAGWSGGISELRGTKTLHINHPHALGTGMIQTGGFEWGSRIRFVINTPCVLHNEFRIGYSYNFNTGESYPVEWIVHHDAELISDVVDAAIGNLDGILKSGPATLTLSGNNTYTGPTRVTEGTLIVSGQLNSPVEVAGGATLGGGGRLAHARLRAGSSLRVDSGKTMVVTESLTLESGTLGLLRIEDTAQPARLSGGGSGRISLGGTLRLDFSGANAGVGQTLMLLPDWTERIDLGLQIETRGLSAGVGLDASSLLVDGSVVLVATEIPDPPPMLPGDRAKADNDQPLDLGSSWIDGVAPGAAERAFFDSRVRTSRASDLGSATSWRGIAMVSNTVDWTIGGSHALTLGPAGVDMDEAGADLRIEAGLILPGTQSWSIAGDRVVEVAGPLFSGEQVEWTKTGEGHLVFPKGVERQMAGDLVISNGTLAVSGGFQRLDDLRIELGPHPIGSGRIRFSDGTILSTAGASGGMGNPMRVDEGMLRVSPGQSLMLAGPIGGKGGLLHDGSGVLRLAGANTFSGGTIVEGGSTLEFTHFRSFGTGPLTLREGAVINGWLPADENNPVDRTIHNEIVLEGNATIENLAESVWTQMYFGGPIRGPGGVRFILDRNRKDIHLTNNNSFNGDLEIFARAGNVVLFAAGPHSLGNGQIVSLSDNAMLGFVENGGRITNRINLNSGSLGFFHSNHTSVDFAGEIFGSGSLSLINRPGTVRLSGDNRNWSGGISGIGSYNVLDGLKRLIVDHPYALGSGEIQLGGQMMIRRNYIEIHIRAPVQTHNDLFATYSGPAKRRNDLLVISSDSVLGALNGEASHDGLDKAGSGRMTLTAHGNYPSPFNVRAGSLKLETGAGFPGKTIIFPGAALIADDARTGSIRVRSGGTIDVKGGGLRTEGGTLTLEGDALMTLRPSDPTAPLLSGDGTRDLLLSGTLLVDFSAISPAPSAGDFVALFGSWNRMVDDGVTVLAAGLDDFMTLDPSTLFTDGRVRVVDGGRIGSQNLEIRVTSGGTGSSSVQVRNPEGVIRYFRLKPGAEWPSWLSATPPTARTAVGSGAQETVTVTANATGLPAGTHHFLLPVVWEHGVSDLIGVTVQVEGPSLTVAPGALTLQVVEDTTGEGSVDLINNGTVPVSYRIRRVLAEHEIYTQPAANVPWITVSPTAQTEITSFTSGRSTPRAIGFGFPFFGTTETAVSVGIDGTLWFGGKPAIRVFSNQLSYLSGTSKVTAKPEADRFIVTWNRMVQPDNAQQTFQAVLHRDGRIDLRYHTIVANSAWQSALIGLHGPTQWFPAQVPETLQGRTIRFERDADTVRISIPQISGTVAAGAVKTLTVSGDAIGLSAGDSRTAIFAIDYDGGLAGTAGEVQVTMDVHGPAPDPVGDGLRDDLASPFYPHGPDPVVVLNPPQRTEEGRRITWRVDGEYGGMQPYAPTVYRIETTTNLLSGSWKDLISVTNKLEYTDQQPMDGPVIFYRIIKEKE